MKDVNPYPHCKDEKSVPVAERHFFSCASSQSYPHEKEVQVNKEGPEAQNGRGRFSIP